MASPQIEAPSSGSTGPQQLGKIEPRLCVPSTRLKAGPAILMINFQVDDFHVYGKRLWPSLNT